LLFASATRFSCSKTWTYIALRLKRYSRMDSHRKFVAKRYQITEVSLTPLVKTTRTRNKKILKSSYFTLWVRSPKIPNCKNRKPLESHYNKSLTLPFRCVEQESPKPGHQFLLIMNMTYFLKQENQIIQNITMKNR